MEGEAGTVLCIPNNDMRLRSVKLCFYFLHLINLYTMDECIDWIAESDSQKEHHDVLLHFIFVWEDGMREGAK